MEGASEEVKGAELHVTTNAIDAQQYTEGAFVDDEMWVSFPNKESGWWETGQTAGAPGNCCTLHPGTITGVMRIAGGPHRTAQADVRTASHVVVTARHPQVTVRTVTNAKGVFTLHVFPGGYRVSGSQAGCVPAIVRVRAYRVTRVNLLCSIR
jgi:hypothetical protein